MLLVDLLLVGMKITCDEEFLICMQNIASLSPQDGTAHAYNSPKQTCKHAFYVLACMHACMHMYTNAYKQTQSSMYSIQTF